MFVRVVDQGCFVSEDSSIENSSSVFSREHTVKLVIGDVVGAGDALTTLWIYPLGAGKVRCDEIGLLYNKAIQHENGWRMFNSKP